MIFVAFPSSGCRSQGIHWRLLSSPLCPTLILTSSVTLLISPPLKRGGLPSHLLCMASKITWLPGPASTHQIELHKPELPKIYKSRIFAAADRISGIFSFAASRLICCDATCRARVPIMLRRLPKTGTATDIRPRRKPSLSKAKPCFRIPSSSPDKASMALDTLDVSGCNATDARYFRLFRTGICAK
jgi:hypothetical protein